MRYEALEKRCDIKILPSIIMDVSTDQSNGGREAGWRERFLRLLNGIVVVGNGKKIQNFSVTS